MYCQRSPKRQSVPGHLRIPVAVDIGTKATDQNDGDDRTIAALGRFRVNDPRTERRTGGRERVRLSASRRRQLRLPAVDNATPHADPILLEQAEVCTGVGSPPLVSCLYSRRGRKRPRGSNCGGCWRSVVPLIRGTSARNAGAPAKRRAVSKQIWRRFHDLGREYWACFTVSTRAHGYG
jgi:hypothetical protein